MGRHELGGSRLRRRSGDKKAASPGAKSGDAQHLFAFEALEPRLLLSADLNAAAGLAFVNGLSAFDTAITHLNSTTALTASAPFINRSLEQVAGLTNFAGLGDPAAALKTAANSYFTANPTTATINGLASAFNALSSTTAAANVTVAATVQTNANPSLETISLTLTSASSVAATATAISASAGGHSLSTTQSLSETSTQTLNLVFGVDITTPTAPVFDVLSAGISSNNEFKSPTGFTGSATVDGAGDTVANGSADFLIDVSEAFAATTAAPLTYTSSSDQISNAVAMPTLTGTSPGAAAPSISLVAVTTGASTLASKVALDDNLATANSETVAVTAIPPSALEAQVLSVFDDLTSEIQKVEGDIDSAASFAFDLPFIGNQLENDLNPSKLFQPILNEITSLETTVKVDLANSGSLLTQVQSDIVSALNTVGLLPDSDATDVVFKYLDSDDAGTQTLAANSSVDLTHVTQLEIDLHLGQQVTSNAGVGANLGLPGLGLSINKGSTITSAINWSFDVGLGLTSSGAYLVAGSSADAGSPINFGVSFYLANGFQAVGTIGFLEGLLTEPDETTASAHTGLFGSIGVTVGGSSSGTGLNGGTEIQLSDIANLTATPNFSLTTQSMLNLAFGVDFEQNPTTQIYSDTSQFPSITAQLEFNWTIDGASLSTGSLPTPTVGLENIEIDLGTAITTFLLPVIKPFYDATNGLQPLFSFLTSEMPIIGQLVSLAADSGVPTSVIDAVLPSYTAGKTYDWLDFAVDMMADDGDISASQAKVISTVGNDAMTIILQLDQTYSDAASGAAMGLMIPLGNFNFSGKNLALPQIDVTNASQIASLGDQIGNFADDATAQSDNSVTNAIMGLGSSLSAPGSALSALAGAGDTLTAVAGDIDDAINTASSAADQGVSTTSTTSSVATATFPFFENPESILGLLFGQQIEFVNVDLGFGAKVTATVPLFAVSFFGIITASLDLNLSLAFDVGIQFGYDSTGILDELKGSNASGGAPSLLDGIYLGGDPELAGTSSSADVLKLDASIGASVNASVLLGLLSIGLEGGIDLGFDAYLTDATVSHPLVHYDQFSQETTIDLDKGEVGPVSLDAQGTVFLDFLYSTLWGFGPSGDVTLATATIFTYPSPAPTLADKEPLGFYDPSTGIFDLYVGSTANQRDNGDDNPIYANPTTAQQILENDSSSYVVDIGANNTVTVWWYNPVTKVWESQTPDGPVSEIIARTGDGNNTILVNNNAPNTVQTYFTGSGGVQYNTNQTGDGSTVTDGNGNTFSASAPTAGALIGGDDVFQSGGGSSTIIGSNGNDVIVGSANPLAGSTPADSISGGNGNDTIVANAGDDTIQAGSGNTVVYAGAGNQVILNQKPPKTSPGTGLKPGDIPAAGSGGQDDVLPPGNDTILAGSAGSFYAPFGPGGDEQLTTTSDVYIPGGKVNQVLVSFEGVGLGTSTYAMVDGVNTIDYGTLQSAVSVDLATGVATSAGFGTETLSGFNVIRGGPIASTLIGGTAAQGSDSIYGGSGGDSITGGGGDDLIVAATATNPAYTGNDIHGGTGNDTIFGGNGHDTIMGGTGKDSIVGGSGGSTLEGGSNDDTIQGGSGADYITSGDDKNLIHTGDGQDVVVVGNGANTIVGEAGNDFITAGDGANIIDDGIGNYVIVAGNGDNSITGLRGDDSIQVGDGKNTIFGGFGDDVIVAGVGANSITGGTGDDTITAGVLFGDTPTIIGGTGANSIYGGTGVEIIKAGNGKNSIYGGHGADQIMVGTGANSIQGGVGDDIIITDVDWSETGSLLGWNGVNTVITGSGANSIIGGTGKDTIEVGNGQNTIQGGHGADQILAGVGANHIDGGTGDMLIVAGVDWAAAPDAIGWGGDTAIIGGSGANSILGGTGDDTILAGDGANTIVGGHGDDVIMAGVGANSITGGFGNDAIDAGVIWSNAVFTVAGTGANIIYGGTGDDKITAGNGDNIIDGGVGDDIIVSGFGNSTIIGGTGNDLITVAGGQNYIDTGTGDSTVIGGSGADVIVSGNGATKVEGTTGSFTATLGDGDNTVIGGTGEDKITVGNGDNVVTGGVADDTIVAGAGNNLIVGGQGNNYISDGAGHAKIEGGGGNDTIYGGALASTILGGKGDDVIVGGAGGNLIVGGAGDTTIQGGLGADSIYGGAGDNLLMSGGGASKIYGDHVGLAFALSAVGALSETSVAAAPGAVNARATIYGGAGSDSLYGGAGSDTIYGGKGTRLIVGGKQATLIEGGAGSGVTIEGGGAGDVIVGSDGGHDSITGGAGNNRIELRGGDDYATNGAGYGVIVGSTGDDTLVSGSGGANTLIGGSASDVLKGNAAIDSLFPDSGATAGDSVTGDALSAATVIPPAPTLPLPSDTVAQGWWSLVAGPAGMTLGGDQSDAASPAIVADSVGPWVAWTEINDGEQGLYVAHDVNGVWQAAGSSATGLGLSLAGATASNPTIALVGGEPIVAWTSTTSAGSAIEVAEYSASAGAWIGLGGSNAAGGISGIGAFDHARIVETGSGPVVVWRSVSGGVESLEALRYNGTSWVDLGASLAVAGSTGAPTNYTVATDGTNIAIAFSAPTAYGSALNVLQSTGAGFAALASPNTSPAVAGENSFSASPTLAYSGGKLFVAWVQQDRTTLFVPRIYAAMETGGVWSAAGVGAASGFGLTGDQTANSLPVLAASGSKLTLVWDATEVTATGPTENLLSLSWNGTSFAAIQPSDDTGTGVGLVAGTPTTLALALDPAGRPWLAVDTAEGTGLQVRAGEASAAHVYFANATTSIASILAGGIAAGSLIVVTATPADASLTLGASAAGVTIYGLDGVSLADGAGVAIDGATGLTIRNLILPGAVSVTSTDKVTLAEDNLESLLTISGATNLFMRDNQLSAVTIAAASQGEIENNTIAGAAIGLTISAAFTGLIANNDISATNTAVVYAAAAALSNNRIHGSPIGVATSIADPATLLGAVAGSTPNQIFGDGVGVELTAAGVVNQHVYENVIGLSGSGLIGGSSSTNYNLINYNQTGVANFTGLIEYNRIEDNGVGIAATSQQQIFSNQIVANTQFGILLSGVNNVQIAGNTIHAYVGDAIHLTAAAYNIEIISNIIWADTGYGIYVDNDSQAGFWSDYNTLYATDTGKIVYWTKDFTDILDWQDDVDAFDLHSVGVTIVNPTWAQPHFGLDANGFQITRPLVGGARPSDPTIDGGDPAGSFIGFNGVANLLVDGNFENGLTGWTFTQGGLTTSTALTPFESTSEFESGPGNNGDAVAQQTVNLSAYATSIDSGSLQLAFGGMVSILTADVSAQISIAFFNASNAQIGNAIVVPAGTSLARWSRVFDTIYVPTGARTAQYIFSVSKTDNSNGALLDDAFLGVIAQGVGQDQGVRTAPDVIPGDQASGRIALLSPTLYTNWVATIPRYITWDSFGAAAGQPVKIELWKQTAGGPVFVSTIAASTPDTGEYAWSPSLSGITAGTAGLLIKISSVATPSISGISTEAFTVPAVGSQFYVATPADGGSNRNTGTSASSPLPNPVNLFRDYVVGAGQTVNIAAGSYPLIVPLHLSGTTDYGFGLEQGFTIDGATGGGTILTPAIPGSDPAALIQLTGSSFDTVNNLTLLGGDSALIVEDASNNFSASYLSTNGTPGAAFNITTNSPTGTLDHLTATNSGGAGLLFSGDIAAITNLTATDDSYGLLVQNNTTTTIGEIENSNLSNNQNYGLNVYLAGASLIENNTIDGNSSGALVDGSGIVFGDANLADGKGNTIAGNTYQGLIAEAAQVVGNVISGTTGNGYAVQIYDGATFSDNVVEGNKYGVNFSESNVTITGNLIQNNQNFGVTIYGSDVTLSRNTFLSNATGVIFSYGSNGAVIVNNVFANDTYAAIQIESSTNTTITNNTLYEPTAGTTADLYDSNFNVGALVLDGASTGAAVTNNIIVALSGVGIQVANAAQAGLVSNYNLFQTGAGGRIGTWLGLNVTTLAQWNAITGEDISSRFGDPLFVAPTAATPDFHVMSEQGSDHGDSLSVVLGGDGLPVETAGAYVDDAASSAAIDGGNPATPLGAEPTAAGDIVEVGAYGGTNQASLSPSSFLTLTTPSAGADLTQGTTVTIAWDSFKVTGDVTLSLSSDGGATFATTIATVPYNDGEAAGGTGNTGSYSWTIPTDLSGADFEIKIASASISGLSGIFSIAPPTQKFYVNASATGGEYTTAGGDDTLNTGTSAASPLASIGALLGKYALGPGAIIYVDAGTYNLSNNIVLTAAQSGITIQGPDDGTVATFNRGSTGTTGFYDFEFNGAKNVTLADLTITGALTGVHLDDGSASTDDTVVASTIQGNADNVYVGTGANDFTLSNSTVADQLSSYDIDISNNSGALIKDDTISLNAGPEFASGINLSSSTFTTISDDTLIGNGATSYLIYGNSPTNLTIDAIHASGSAYYGVLLGGASGVVENSTISGGTQTLEISGVNQGAVTIVARNNTIFGEVPGNAYGGALIIDNDAEGLDNTVYGSDLGVSVSGLAAGNIVYGNTTGILVSYQGTVEGNTVYANTAAGIVDDGDTTYIENNIVYDNPIGIQIGRYSNSVGHYVLNNTIVQTSGVALNVLPNGVSNTTFIDNVVSLTNAVGIVAPASSQTGFVSDYNLYDLESGATLATWSGQSFADLTSFKVDINSDLNSIAANPDFVNAAQDDYLLSANSPALNRGDPSYSYVLEPVGPTSGDGDRIDIGAEGGTAQANPAPQQLVQLLGATGGQRYVVGAASTISFRSAGLTAVDPVIFISATAAVPGSPAWQANSYVTSPNSAVTNSTPVSANGLDVPQAVIQSAAYFYAISSTAPTSVYQVPVADGAYQVTLIFADPYSSAVGQRLFDIFANGQSEATSYDIYKAAGGPGATALTFDVTTSGGAGLNLALQAIYGNPLLSGVEISRINPKPTTWTASAQVSYNNGATWTTIAQGLSLDAFGTGSFTFTPTATTSQGLLKIVATNGSQTVSDISKGTFLSAPAGNEFYISANGSDSNNGKSVGSPMASLAALLNVYTLSAGDVVNVAAGTYSLPTAIVLGASASGSAGDPVEIVGAGASTIFTRNTTASGTSAFDFDGGHDIILKDLAIVGGSIAVDIQDNSGAANLSFQDIEVSGFSGYGVYVGSGSSNFSMTGSTVDNPTSGGDPQGVVVSNTTSAVLDHDTFTQLYYAVYIEPNNYSPLGIDVTNNTFSLDNVAVEGYVPYTPTGGAYLNIENNTITSSSYGISVQYQYGTGIVSNNTITDEANVGIQATINTNAVVESNILTDDNIGLELAGSNATAIDNTISDNATEGIYTGGANGGLIAGNTLLSNAKGVELYGYGLTIKNNLIEGSTGTGVDAYNYSNSTPDLLLNNTIVQSGGAGLVISGDDELKVENNIFVMTGGMVYLVPATSETSLLANYNLFDLVDGAVMGSWAGNTVATLDGWLFQTGEDVDSLSGDPKFVNSSADDFFLAPSSPGIDSGDPVSAFGLEPGNNGGRINLGIEGDTANATPSAAVAIQVNGPAPLAKLQDGVATTINFATSGVSGVQAVARVSYGSTPIAGVTPATNWVAGSTLGYSVASAYTVIDTSGSLEGTPSAVYADEIYAAAGIGDTIAQTLAVADGTYVVTLNFAEYYNVGVGGRTFDIVINGKTVAANFDVYAAAGDALDKAVDRQFTVSASGGAGIVIQLVNDTAANSAILSGIDLDRKTTAVANATAKIEASPDNGVTWELVDAAAPLDAFGDGSLTWTPDFITDASVNHGDNALIRVTVNGVAALSQNFLVTNSGNDYYVNDGSTVGDQYTSAVGNDLNSGKTPGAPMADLAALLRAYTLAPGDIVFVDTGSYTLLTDLTLGAGDSGASAANPVTFQGPTNGGAATLNRDNANGSVFAFAGASFVDINNLTITGGYIGLNLEDGTNSDNVTATNDVITNAGKYGVYIGSKIDDFILNASQVYGSGAGYYTYGIYRSTNDTSGNVTITGNQIFGQYFGIYSGSGGGVISGNIIYNNSNQAIDAYSYSATDDVLYITNNQIFDNANSSGNNSVVYLYGYGVDLSDNIIYGQSASGDVGVYAQQGVTIQNNVIYGNYLGLYISDTEETATGNRIFDNSYAGVEIGGNGGSLIGNQIYSNGIGVVLPNALSGYYYYNIQNNTIYDNSAGAIDVIGGGGGGTGGTNTVIGNEIVGNTIWQATGTAIALSGTSTNTTIADNIIIGEVGTLITVSSGSETGFSALYNLYYEGAFDGLGSDTTPATLVNYGGTVYANLSAWLVASPTLNVGSLEANPDFVAIAGADGVLGGPDTAIGGGKDDNFSPAKGSPAIDASDAYLQSPTDLLGQGRHDDPSTPNTGTGAPVYVANSSAALAPPAGTSATLLTYPYQYVGGYTSYALPFNFTFYGVTYTTLYISPAGAIFFSAASASNSTFVGNPTAANLASTAMIAPFWSANMDTRYSGNDGIWAITSSNGGVNYVTISFATTPTSGNYQTAASTFAARLGSDGSLLFEYGANLTSAAVIGVSAGTKGNYTLAANSGQSNLSNAAAIGFTPDAADGFDYYDIGAIEFEGSSSDSQSPTITSTSGLPANGATSTSVFTSVTLAFSAALDAISATSAANYQLIAAGPDGKFGTSDDIAIAVTPVYSAATNSVTLLLPGGPLSDGDYQLTVSPTNQLLDASGNPLNGDANTTNAASPFVSQFVIDRSTIQPPVISSESTTTPSNIALAFTLSATDPQGLAVTFAIATAPLHGAIENFDAAAGTFTYVPDIGYLGADTIVYSATDSKLASSQATISIAVTAYRTPPVASAASASAIAGEALTITLQGYDAQIPANQLVLSIVTQPKHGVVTITGQNTVSYVATNGYSGADAFSYAWSDTGTPVLTSAPATVSLSVITINHAPVADAATISALENVPYVFKTADFPFSDPNDTPANKPKALVFVSLPGVGVIADNGVAVIQGQAVSVADIAAGKLTYAPATGGFGAAYASFSYAWQDDGGTANGGADTSAPASATINVKSNVVTKAPTTGATTITAFENQAYAFKATDFPFSDSNTPANALAAVIVTTLLSAGALTDSGVAVTLNQVIALADIVAGKLVFTPAANLYGASYASFSFEVQSDGGTANGGVNISAPATATIDVAQFNHAPVTDAAAITVFENGSHVFTAADFPFMDPNDPHPNTLAAIVIGAPPSVGALTDGGVAVTTGQVISVADIASGKFIYKPATKVFGQAYASFTFQVEDNGGTANGGSDISTSATATINVDRRVVNADKSYDIDFVGVIGQPYNSYVKSVSATGQVQSISYSNGMSAAWTYANDGSYVVKYTGVTGQQYVSYSQTHATDGRVVSALYSNGMSATWTYAKDGSYSVAWTGVTGETFVSYTQDFGANGKATSATYSNGRSATWTYGADGSYTIAYANGPGFTYANYTTTYNAAGQAVSAVYGDGSTATWTHSALDASYTIAYAGVTGEPYASYTVSYGVNGDPASASYSNGQTETWTYTLGGTIATTVYAGVTGEPYSGYSVSYGANGNPASASFSNKQTETWSYAADGELASVAFAGVTGADYNSYVVTYGPNGVSSSALYSNGQTETWAYSANGVVSSITFAGVTGAQYTGYTTSYGASGTPTSALYNNGQTEIWAYSASGAVLSVTVAGVTGAPYTGYKILYGSNGKAASAAYDNGQSEIWTYDPVSGALVSIAYTGVTGAAYTGYTVTYGSNGKSSTAIFSNAETETWTYLSNGEIATIEFDGVTGAAYSSYKITYGANGDPSTASYNNGLLATWAYGANGQISTVTYSGVKGAYTSYVLSYGATGHVASAAYNNGLAAVWTYKGDGSYQVLYSGVPGKFEGLNYATYINAYDTAGVLASRTYYDAGGHVVATITYSSGGKTTITVSDEDSGSEPTVSLATDDVASDDASPAEKAPISLAAVLMAPILARHDDVLLLGAERVETKAARRLETMIGPSPSRSDMAQAFFLAGIMLPIAARTLVAPATRKRPTLATFDSDTDAFEPFDPELDASDLPRASHEDTCEPDWDVLG